MRKNLLALLAPAFIIIGAVFCGCHMTEFVPDQVLFQEFEEPVHLHTVQSYYTQDHGVCSVQVPIPGDSVVRYIIDLDNDQQADFELILDHHPWDPTQYCGHCSIYEYDIRIEGKQAGDSIAVRSDYHNIAGYFYPQDTIHEYLSWQDQVVLSLEGGCARPVFHLEEAYIGLKKGNLLGWLSVSPLEKNGIIIHEMAVNLTEGNSIIVGQIE